VTANKLPQSDNDFMRVALAEARVAASRNEVPVGAVLVREGLIIARGANRPIAACDPSAHAEIETLRAAGKALQTYRLTASTLYVTLEPCIMCAAALVHARVQRVVFGAWDPKAGAAGSISDVFGIAALNHRIDVFGGVLADECGALLTDFFAARRG
jgi:tRNA(adenine34) deaminase